MTNFQLHILAYAQHAANKIFGPVVQIPSDGAQFQYFGSKCFSVLLGLVYNKLQEPTNIWYMKSSSDLN